MPESRYADQWVEPAWALPPKDVEKWDPNDVVEVTLALLIDDHKRLSWAAQIPRRLGGQATAQELRMDKVRMRSSAHLMVNLIGQWKKLATPELQAVIASIDPGPIPQNLRAEGAQMIWFTWAQDRMAAATEQRSIAVTVALQRGDRSWANRVGRILTTEIDELSRLLRQYP
jgi:hypothetical protein